MCYDPAARAQALEAALRLHHSDVSRLLDDARKIESYLTGRDTLRGEIVGGGVGGSGPGGAILGGSGGGSIS